MDSSRNFTAGGRGDSGMAPLNQAPSFDDDQFGSYDIDQLANYSAADQTNRPSPRPEQLVPQGSSSSNYIVQNTISPRGSRIGEIILEQKETSSEEEAEKLEPMKEMLYKLAAMQPVEIDPATIQKPKRRNVRISHDPQSVAARHRRERISERMRILQRLVPGANKMDTATMLDEAIRYVKFLKKTVHDLQYAADHASGTRSATNDDQLQQLPLNIGQINNTSKTTTTTTMDWPPPPPPPNVGPAPGGIPTTNTTSTAQQAASTGSSTNVLCKSSMDHH